MSFRVAFYFHSAPRQDERSEVKPRQQFNEQNGTTRMPPLQVAFVI